MQIYDKLPSAAQKLARIPRYARLIATLPEERFGRIENGASTYWELYTYVSEFSIDDSGVLDCGLRADGARLLGWHEKDEPLPEDRDHQFRTRQVALAMAMLSAMAFEMMFGSPDSESKSSQDSELFVAEQTAKKEDGDWLSFRDEIAGSEEVDIFTNMVQNRLTESNAYFLGNPAHPINTSRFIVDWRRLKALNAQGLEFLALSAYDTTIRFRDISLHAFLAAYWVCNYATDSHRLRILKTLPYWERTESWNDMNGNFIDRNAKFTEFWNLLLDMPTIWMTEKQNHQWIRMFSLIYKPPSEHWIEGTTRPTDLIYRSWERMAGTKARFDFENEYAGLRNNEVAERLLYDKEGNTHFLSLCEGERSIGDPESLRDDGVFGRKVLKHYRLHRYCVTNLEYELFDASHVRLREFEKDGRDVSRHPVVNVSWYDAWCFAKWLGKRNIGGVVYKIALPKEEDWEYACRCKETTGFTWHDHQNGDRIESGCCNFDGNYPFPWRVDETLAKPIHLERTIPVDGRDLELEVKPNPWGFHQMHGNVWEWCCDWYKERLGRRAQRGGSWYDLGELCRAGYRRRFTPSTRHRSNGFRLAAVPMSQARNDERE